MMGNLQLYSPQCTVHSPQLLTCRKRNFACALRSLPTDVTAFMNLIRNCGLCTVHCGLYNCAFGIKRNGYD
ncbi:MAG: hypothetical protein LBL66_08195 [Clostridiales bacterium]|nr:hypothetical protein [Clostridiales bacterium]